MTKTSIAITHDDIDNGLSGNGDLCPIALACRREFPGAKIFVSGNFVSVEQFETITMHRLSNTGVKFVKDFDACAPVMPLTVVLTEMPFYA